MYRVYYLENGQKRWDIIQDADSLEDIYRNYLRQGKTVLQVKKHSPLFSLNLRGSVVELVYIFQALADLLDSGHSLSRSLKILVDSMDAGSPYRDVFVNICREVQSGENFSDVIQKYRTNLGNTATQMIRSGYETGRLSDNLRIIAEYLLDMHQVKKELIKKTAYPVCIFLVSLILLVVNTRLIIPRIVNSEIFAIASAKGVAPSVYVKVLQVLSVVVPSVTVLFVALMASLYVLYRLYPLKAERLFLKIPLLCILVFDKTYFMCFFSLAKLLQSGTRLLQALEVVKESVTVEMVKNEFRNAIQCLARGEPFTSGFRYLSYVERQMLQWSLDYQRMALNLEAVAKRFYRRYVSTIKLISPFLYGFTLVLVAGVFVLVFLSVFVPYIKVISQLGG